jgi:hypothetical protein
VFQKNDRVRVSEIGSQTVSTSDLKAITLAGALRYRIGDVVKLYNNVHQPESTITAHIHGICSEYITTHTLDECKPAALITHVMSRLNLSEYGLEGVDFTLTDFVVVKTYRFITGEIYKYTDSPLTTYNGRGGNEPVSEM